MQRELRGFTHRADKQQQAGYGNQIRAQKLHARHIGQIGEHILIAQAAAKIRQHQPDAEQETEIAHAVHQKRFQIGKNGRRFFEIKPNQQIRHQAHGFPAEKELDKVVRHNQHQHAECKQGDIAEKALIADCFVVHIANGVDVHHQRHHGYHHHHHGGEAVHQEAHGEIHAAHGEPCVHVFIELGARARGKAVEHPQRQRGGDGNAEYGGGVCACLPDAIAEQSCQQAACQRG